MQCVDVELDSRPRRVVPEVRGQVADRIAHLPHPHEAEILVRVADVRELEVEHRAHAGGVEDELVGPDVAPAQADATRRGGDVMLRPMDAQLEERLRIARLFGAVHGDRHA